MDSGKLCYYLENHGQLIMLPQGQILVGRGIECGVRFNDMSVSRHHLVLTVSQGEVIVEDVGSANGTRVNGRPLTASRALNHGDILQIGRRFARLELHTEAEDESSTPPAGLPGLNRVVVAAPSAEEGTLPKEMSYVCPKCRTPNVIESDVCGSCGYRWKRRNLAVTQQIEANHAERRVEPRLGANIPLLYESSFLELETKAVDLSRGGLFVESELLDPVGTDCRLVLLPDGQPAVAIEGRVCHIRRNSDDSSEATGMGIQFGRITEKAARWLGQSLSSMAEVPRPESAP